MPATVAPAPFGMGRYKSCLVDSERYLLICQRYIELNPVRARITDDAVPWRWSSCAAHLG